MKKLFSVVIAVAAVMLFTGYGMPEAKPAAPKGGKTLADGKSQFAKYGTNKVRYITVGKGKQTVLFIHGWSCNASFWQYQVPALADKARLIFIDLPGHGNSDKPETAYTMDYFAGAVLAVMKDAKADKAVLVGHSMGTPVMCRVYKQSPDKVAALVAVDGVLRRPKMSEEQTERFIGPYRKDDYKDFAKRFVGSMFPNPGTETMRDWTTAEMLLTPQHVMLGAMEGMFNADQPDWDLQKVSVPVLVINAKSPMWTAEYEDYVKSLSDKTDYRVIEGTGHFVQMEKADEFNAALVEGLQKFNLIGK